MMNYILPASGFTIFGLEIKFYGVIMALSMLAGIIVACILAKKKLIKSDDILLLALIVLPFSVIGARAYYCIFYNHIYSFQEFFNIRQGGMAIYGGVIGGFLGMILFCLIKKNFKALGTICDIVVPCLILGQAMGRWGNFFNQEAYGNLITNPNFQWFPFGVYIESSNFTAEASQQIAAAGMSGVAGAWFNATFFYESMWNFAGFALLLVVFYKTKLTLTTTGAYLTWYGLGRMLIEGMRTDSLYVGSTNIRVSQLLSCILLVVGVTILVVNIIRRVKKRND